jgi:hypothetical protein
VSTESFDRVLAFNYATDTNSERHEMDLRKLAELKAAGWQITGFSAVAWRTHESKTTVTEMQVLLTK